MSFTFDPYSLKNGQVSEAEDVILTNPTALRDLERYWASLPRTDNVPNRKDVDPTAMAGLLEDCFILERVAPSVARIRVAGRAVTKLFGMEPRGLPMTTAFLPHARAPFTKHLEAAFDGPNIVELSLESPRGIGQPKLEGKILMLPLRDESGEVTRILGALVMSGRRGVGTRRFSLLEASSDRVEKIGIRPAIARAPLRLTPEPSVAPRASAPSTPMTRTTVAPKSTGPRLKSIAGGAQGIKTKGDKATLRLVVSNPD